MVERYEGERNLKRVLVVEDDEDWRTIYTRKFRRLGAEVVEAANLEEAQRALAAGDFTHVVTDGLEGDWKGVVEKAGDAKVALVSGRDLKREAEELGANYIDKADIPIKVGYDELIGD